MTTNAGAVETLRPTAIPVGVGVPYDGEEMPGHLGVFQRAMLRWNDQAPYNAVHVARISGAFDRERLHDTVAGILADSGLTGLVLDRRGRRFHYRGGPARVSLEVLAPGDISASLAGEIRAQISAPFALDEPFTPIRFFAIPDGDHFYLGTAYCHFISDADPIVAVMGAIASAYQGDETLLGAWDPYPAMRRQLLPLIFKSLPWCLAGLPRFVLNMSRSVKPHYSPKRGRTNGYTFFTIGAPQLGKLSEASHRWGVTLNDVFLAALARAVRPLAARRAAGGKRDRIAVSSIASIRKDLRWRCANKVAPFLGSYAVFQPLSSDDSLEGAARNVNMQSAAAKKHRIYLRTIVDLHAENLLLRFTSAERRDKIFRQNYPLWGGVSSLNLDSPSCRAEAGAMSGYLRAVSTGPACPLVLSLTTLGGELSVGVSYRTAVFSPEAISGIISSLKHSFENPSGAQGL